MAFVSYAQNFEDVVLFRALKQVWNGTYVDVGAFDPEKDSVTKAFYDRGWSGINVEPIEAFCEKLIAARPRDRTLHAAAGDVEGELTCYVIPETGLSTLDRETAERHRAEGLDIQEMPVPVLRLADILKDFENRPIHFLKIDVEGFEDSVLAGMDFERIRPWILVIEATIPTQQVKAHGKWEARVLERGYSFAFFDGLSRYYIADEHAELGEPLAIPANVFDDYETAHSLGLRQALHAAGESYNRLSEKLESERRGAEGYADNLNQRIRDLEDHIAGLEARIEEQERRIAADHRDAAHQLARRLADQAEAASQEEQRLHEAIQAMRDHVSRLENSRGWRLVLALRRPLNYLRRLKRSLFPADPAPASSLAIAPKAVSLASELNFASKEFARRVAIKAALKKR